MLTPIKSRLTSLAIQAPPLLNAQNLDYVHDLGIPSINTASPIYRLLEALELELGLVDQDKGDWVLDHRYREEFYILVGTTFEW